MLWAKEIECYSIYHAVSSKAERRVALPVINTGIFSHLSKWDNPHLEQDAAPALFRRRANALALARRQSQTGQIYPPRRTSTNQRVRCRKRRGGLSFQVRRIDPRI